MNIYTISSLLAYILSILLSLFVWFRSTDKDKKLSFVYIAIMAGTWSLFPFVSFLTHASGNLLFFVRLIYVAAIFTAPAFLNFGLVFTEVSKKSIRWMINRFVFYAACLFLPFVFSDLFIRDVIVAEPYCSLDPGPLFIPFIIFFFIVCSYVFIQLVRAFVKSKGEKKNQFLYIFLAYFLAFVSALIHFATIYGVREIIPHDFFVLSCMCILAYAVVKFRLMNIQIAFANTAIFLVIYALVLGVPFYIYAKGHNAFIAMCVMLVLATAGPFIYIYFQKRAEDQILIEQRRYQTTLRQASAGMGRIKDLKKLLYMIVYVLTRSVRIDHALIYMFDNSKSCYRLGAYKRRFEGKSLVDKIEINCDLVKNLIQFKKPLVLDDLNQRLDVSIDATDIEMIVKTFKILDAAIIFPIFIDRDLTAIVVMGAKENGKLYTEEDLSVFTILSNQAALAIENAQFYEDMKKTQEQLFQAEKMATIGTMADGLSHQINNRFHALGFIASDAIDTIQMNRSIEMSDKVKSVIDELENALKRVQENVVQGGEVVQGLLRYTRKGDAAFTAVDIDAVLKSAIEMTQFKIKTHELKIIRNYDVATMPKVKGNFTQLQEVFFNLIDNGYDAMMQRKVDLNEPNYQPTIKVSVESKDNKVLILFEDNGIGVKEEDVQKLFTPFFTTKLSSKKGTGLGLYVIKKIIEDNHLGRVEFASKYMNGTQMRIFLPPALS